MTFCTTTSLEEAVEFQERSNGPNENEITVLAQQGLPLSLPWGRKVIRLGTTFHSSLDWTEDPWSNETPFVLSDIHMTRKELHADYGTNSTMKKIVTHKESETNDHLTLGFGVGVGLPFLASASVKGTYDNHVQENKDSDKMSLTSSCRAGTVEFHGQPRLTREAIIEIKYGGGYEGFCQRYGDYYLAGYKLGGDTALMMSASGQSRKEVDKYTIKATVTILFVSASKSWEKEFDSFRSGRNVQLVGYDTIDGKNWQERSAMGDDVKDKEAWATTKEGTVADISSLRKATDEIMTRSENMLERVFDVLEKHGLRSGQSVSFAQAEELVREGIVVELLLQPMSRLREVMQWRLEKNII